MFGRSKKLANESFYEAEEDSVLDGAEEEEEEEYYHNPPPQSHHEAVAQGQHPLTSDTHGKKNWFHIPNILGGRKNDEEESVDSREDQSIAMPADEEEQAMLYLAQEASEAEFHRKQEMKSREDEEIRRVMQESVLEEQNRRQRAAHHHPLQVPHHGPSAGGHYADLGGISPHEAEQLRYIQQVHQPQQPHHVSSPHGREDHHHAETGLEHHVQQMNLHHDSAGPHRHQPHFFPHAAGHNYGSTAGHHHHHHSSVGARDDPAGLQAAMAILTMAQRHFEHDPLLTSIETQRHAWELTGQWLAQASAQLQLADRHSSHHSGHQQHHHGVAVPAPPQHQAPQHHRQPVVPHFEDVEWECPACTLMNQATFLTCEACGHPCR